MQRTICPSHDRLSRYLSGNLSVEEIDEIADHVSACAQCDTAVGDLERDSDSLLFALRQPPLEDRFELEPELQRVVSTVREEIPAAEQPGTSCSVLGTVREYDLLEKIGAGGMGTVYKALHSRLKRIVALKVLAEHRLHDPAAVTRFSREMQAVGKLAHPNIVKALDAGEADGRHYLVMEFIDGIDLSRLSRRCGPLPVAEACELVLQAALALQHAHEHDLVHRDVKPSNLMLTRDGNVKVLDLGIALLQTDEPITSELTGTGQIMGTLDYMAPEQLDNTHAVDIRADVYGLGATLYKLLCGSPPATDSQSQFRMPGESVPPVPNIRTIRADIPKPLAAVIERMLAPNPDNRPATPAAVANELEPFAVKSNLPQLALAAASDTPRNPAYIPNRFRRWTRRFLLAAAILIGVALAGFAITVQTDKGQLVIESSDENIEVVVKRSGQLYDSLDELEVGKGKNHWSFRSGSYEVRLVGKTDGLRVEGGKFTLTRGGKAVVTISREGGRKTATVAGPTYDGKTFAQWIRLIADEKWPERRIEGIKALAALGRGEHVEEAVTTIIDVGSAQALFEIGNDDLTMTAIRALIRIGSDDAFPPLLVAAGAKEVQRRRFALNALSHFEKTDESQAQARIAVADPDSIVRKHAASVLYDRGVSEIARLLEQDVDVDVRRHAAKLLRTMGKKAQPALPAILAAMTDVDEQVRKEVLTELRILDPALSMLEPVAIKALNSKNPQIRGNVGVRILETISKHGSAAIPAYIAVLEKTDLGGSSAVKEGSRNTEIAPLWNLIRGLGNFGPDAREALPLLKKRLKHEDEGIRTAAAVAIRKISGEAVQVSKTAPTGPVYDGKTFAQWITELKTEKFPERRVLGIKALAALVTKENAQEAAAVMIEVGAEHSVEQITEDDSKVTNAALQALDRMRDEQVTPLLLDALKSEDVRRRRFAVSSLNVPEYFGGGLPTVDKKFSDETLKNLFDHFNDPDLQVRRGLSRLFTRIGKPAKPVMLRMFETDKDQDVRFYLLRGFSNFDDEGIALLTHVLEKDADINIRRQAAHILESLGEKARPALPQLLAAMHSPDEDLRSDVLSALKSIKPSQKQLNEVLLNTLKRDDSKIRSDVVDRLLLMVDSNSPDAIPALAEALIDRNQEVRHAVLQLIFQLQKYDKQMVAALEKALENNQAAELEYAILIFSGLSNKHPESVKALLRIYQKSNRSRRLDILNSILKNGGGKKSLLPIIEAGLKSEDEQIKAAATDAHQFIRARQPATAKTKPSGSASSDKPSGPVYDGKTFDEWITLLKTDKSAQRRVEGIKALGALHTEKNGPITVAAIIDLGGEHVPESVRIPFGGEGFGGLSDNQKVLNAAQQTFVRIGAEQVVPQLLAALESKDAQSRRFALTALPWMPFSENMLPSIIAASRDANAGVRRLVARQLFLAGERGVAELTRMLEHDKDISVQSEAAGVLLFLGEKARPALPQLLAAISSPHPGIRGSALNALETLKPDQKTLNDALLKALSSKDVEVRRSVMRVEGLKALCSSKEALPVLLWGLTDADQQVSSSVFTHMHQTFLKNPESLVAPLADMLDENPKRNMLRLYALLKMFGPAAKPALPALIRRFKIAGDEERRHIVGVYHSIGPDAKEALPQIEVALKSQDKQLRDSATRALPKVTGEKKARPKAMSDQPTETLKLHVGADGKAAMDGIPLTDADLKQILEKSVKNVGKRGLVVSIKADPQTRLDVVMKLIDTCKAAGAEKVTLDGTPITPPRENKDGAAVYDGKTLDEWLALLKAEKNPEKRKETLTPIKTLGIEAPDKVIPILIDVAGEYDFSDYLSQDPDYFWTGQTIDLRDYYVIHFHLAAAILELSKNNVPKYVFKTLADKRINHRRLAFHLIRHLPVLHDEESPKERAAALKLLQPQLQKGINDEDAYVRHEAIAARYELFGEAPYEFLLQTLKSKEPILQRFAVRTLGNRLGIRLPPEGTFYEPRGHDVSTLGDKLDAKAVSEFKRVQDSETKLISVFKDKETVYKSNVLFLLVNIDPTPEKIIPLLMDELYAKEDEGQFRRDLGLRIALYGLRKIGAEGKPAVPKLIQLLKDYQTFFRQEDGTGFGQITNDQDQVERLIIKTLGKIGPSAKPALPAIAERLKYSDEETRKAAERAIEQITGKVPATTK